MTKKQTVYTRVVNNAYDRISKHILWSVSRLRPEAQRPGVLEGSLWRSSRPPQSVPTVPRRCPVTRRVWETIPSRRPRGRVKTFTVSLSQDPVTNIDGAISSSGFHLTLFTFRPIYSAYVPGLLIAFGPTWKSLIDSNAHFTRKKTGPDYERCVARLETTRRFASCSNERRSRTTVMKLASQLITARVCVHCSTRRYVRDTFTFSVITAGYRYRFRSRW